MPDMRVLGRRVARRPADPDWRPLWRALAVLSAGVGLFVLASIFVWAPPSDGWGYDMRAYYEAAQRFVATGSPYQPETLSGPFRPGPGGLYLYSPVIAALFVPVTSLPFEMATLGWLALRSVMVVATVALMPVRREVRLAMLGTLALALPALRDLNLGNVSLIVTFLAVICWRYLDRPAGALAVAVSLFIRPPMALIAAWWLLRRQWLPLLWTVAGTAVVALASIPVVGLERWFEYALLLRNLSGVTGVANNADLASVALSLGLPDQLAPLVLIASYILAVGAVVLSLRRDREVGFAVTLMATLLISPLLWDHYLTNLLVPGALLAARGRRWGVFLPLLGWLPLTLLPLVTVAAMLLPLTLPAVVGRRHDADLDEPDLTDRGETDRLAHGQARLGDAAGR
jgi:hypothetical protein